MQQAMQEMGKSSQPLLNIIAVCTLIGSAGLILPAVLGLPGWIIPVTAVILALMMLFSIIFHIKYRENPKVFAGVILFAMTAFVAYGRWVFVPL